MYPIDASVVINKNNLPNGGDKSKVHHFDPACKSCGRRPNVLIQKGIIKQKTLEDILVLPIIPNKLEGTNARLPKAKTSKLLTGIQLFNYI